MLNVKKRHPALTLTTKKHHPKNLILKENNAAITLKPKARIRLI